MSTLFGVSAVIFAVVWGTLGGDDVTAMLLGLSGAAVLIFDRGEGEGE